MSSASDIVKRIKDEEIEWVDVRFTDPKGKWQHLSMCAGLIDEDQLEEGFMFDGSSIEGWKVINESDMILKPDLDAVYVDPFSATPMLVIFCNIVEPSDGSLYARDPRSTAKRAEAFLKSTGLGDTVYVGVEPEFFMFDDVRFFDGYNGSGFEIDDIELPTNTGTEMEGGNLGHRPRAKGGYFPVAPVDSCMDIRAEMVSTMLEMGLPMDKQHHEVAAAQHELGMTFGQLTETADRTQVYKYVTQMVADAYGKTATFMPKPIKEDNGSGMHTHMSIWKDGQNTFAGDNTPVFRKTASITSAASSSTPRHVTLSPTRRPTATSVWSRALKRLCCWPIRPVTALLLAVFHMVRVKRPSALNSVSRIHSPTLTCPPQLC